MTSDGQAFLLRYEGQNMARRLSLEARRREILEQTRQMIIKQGPEGLSLRAVARWCGMSAPGVLHHFDGIQPLLEEVLQQQHDEQAQAFVDALPEDPTLREWADTVAKVSMSHVEGNRNFDALETQALANPEHPAHNFYLRQIRPFPATVALAKKDYPRDPDMVVEVLGTVVDGLRLRWIRSTEPPDYYTDWRRIADTVFAGFEQYRT